MNWFVVSGIDNLQRVFDRGDETLDCMIAFCVGGYLANEGEEDLEYLGEKRRVAVRGGRGEERGCGACLAD
jgi:hypothetical protein